MVSAYLLCLIIDVVCLCLHLKKKEILLFILYSRTTALGDYSISVEYGVERWLSGQHRLLTEHEDWVMSPALV